MMHSYRLLICLLQAILILCPTLFAQESLQNQLTEPTNTLATTTSDVPRWPYIVSFTTSGVSLLASGVSLTWFILTSSALSSTQAAQKAGASLPRDADPSGQGWSQFNNDADGILARQQVESTIYAHRIQQYESEKTVALAFTLAAVSTTLATGLMGFLLIPPPIEKE